MKTNEQLEKQISEEFEKIVKSVSEWSFWIDDLQGEISYTPDNRARKVEALHKEELEKEFNAFALPLMKKIEELERSLQISKIQYGFNLEDVARRSGGTFSGATLKLMELDFEQRELKLQKENEKLKVALEWWTKNYATPDIVTKRCLSIEHIEKFNLDKEGGK